MRQRMGKRKKKNCNERWKLTAQVFSTKVRAANETGNVKSKQDWRTKLPVFEIFPGIVAFTMGNLRATILLS
jgi:hypothetical protein